VGLRILTGTVRIINQWNTTNDPSARFLLSIV
jgi:hypothetical protein